MVSVEESGDTLVLLAEGRHICEGFHLNEELLLLQALQTQLQHANALLGRHKLHRMAQGPRTGISLRDSFRRPDTSLPRRRQTEQQRHEQLLRFRSLQMYGILFYRQRKHVC